MDTTTPFAAMGGAARSVLAATAGAVVRIGRHGGRGCGLVVGPDAVLTNAHNLRDRTTEITFAGGRRAQGAVLAADVDGDLVVLTVDTGDVVPLTWSPEAGQPGDVVYAVARTAQGGSRVTVGFISSVDGRLRGPRGRDTATTIEHTAPLAQGSTGGPLLDPEGRLVGVNTSRLEHGFTVALPADAALRTRVDALLRGESPRRRTLGLGLAPAEVAARLRASVGLGPRDGLLVRTVDPNGPAAAGGVLVGDLVAGAGGAVVTTVGDLHRALDAATATLDLLVVRGNDELIVTVRFDEIDPDGAIPA